MLINHSDTLEAMDIEHTSPQESGGAKEQEARKTRSEERRQKVLIRLFEVLISTPAILIVIGLFSIPTVFYALPYEANVSVGKTSTEKNPKFPVFLVSGLQFCGLVLEKS